MKGKNLRSWFESRSGAEIISRFLKTKKVPLHQHTPWYFTGSSILLFFLLQVITGILLALYYKPTIEEANASVARIMTEIPLGWVIRSVHFWSSTFMIASVFIHFLGIWLIKSYRSPRELTWMSGAFLLLLTLAFGFTGYLLPWDDLSLAATKVGTDIPRSIPVVGAWVTKFLRGGEDVTGDTLTRFFIIHVCVLPLLLIAFVAGHLYLVQKHGMSLPLKIERKREKVEEIPFWPNFVSREAIVWLILGGILLTMAVLFPPSLGKKADLMAPAPEGIRPEWYFLFLFQTYKIFPAKVLFVSGDTLATIAILIAALLFLFLPLIDNRPAEKKGKVITLLAYGFILYALAMSLWSLLH